MKRIVIVLSVIVFSVSIYAQKNQDSLWAKWNQKQLNDSIRLHAIEELSEATVRNHPDSGYALAKKMLDLALQKKNKNFQAKAYFLQGRAYSYMPKYDKALTAYSKSIEIFDEIENLKGKAKSMAYLAGLHNYQRDYSQAIDYAIQVMDIANQIGDIERRSGVSKVLGNSYMKIGKYEKAINVYQKGLRDAEKVDAKIEMAFFLNAIGDLFLEQRDDKQAMEYLNKSLLISQEVNDKMSIADAYRIMGKVALFKKDFLNALELFRKALSIYKEANNQAGIGQTLYNIGRVHKEEEKFELAESFFSKAKQIAKETSYQGYNADLLIQEGIIKIEQGQPSKAITLCYETYTIAKKSNMIKQEQEACECLYRAYKQLNNTEKALLFHEEMTLIMRKIQLEETSKNLQRLENMRTKLRDSILKVEQKRLEEAQIARVESETSRRHGLQYTGILIFVVMLFLTIFVSGKFSLNTKIASGLVFFTFLLFFEFILVLLSPIVGTISKGEPAFVLLCNAFLAGLIIPIHTFFEKSLKKKINNNRN